MQDVPNIVRERLKAASPGANHPDADVLTAFAEQSLPERERTGVIEHLARCSDCRGVIALALPALESTVPVAVVVSRSPSPWFAWPALRWGFAVAGIAMIATFGILQLRLQDRHQAAQIATVAKESHNQDGALYAQPQAPQPAAVPAAMSSSNAKSTLAAPQMPATGQLAASTSESRREPRLTSRAALPAAAPQGRNALHSSVAGAATFSPKMPAYGQQQQKSQQEKSTIARVQALPAQAPTAPNHQAPNQPAASAAPAMDLAKASQTVTVEVSAAAPLIDTEAQNAQVSSSQPSPELSSEDAGSHFGKAKPAMAPEASSLSIPRWTISSTGGLQRSFDQGNTWQDVDVTANLISPVPFAFADRAPLTSNENARSENAKGMARAEATTERKKQATPQTFRAVAVTGLEVWAGGSAGVLYHSVDAGNRWTRVVPSTDGAVLAGDIVSLEFPDAQHGKITTSTAQVWITADDGQTWQKQQ